MKECMVQADPPKKASMFERMNGQSQLLFSDKMTHYFIEWTTPSGLLKKRYIITLAKNLILQLKTTVLPKEN